MYISVEVGFMTLQLCHLSPLSWRAVPVAISYRLLPATVGKLEVPEKSEAGIHMGRVTGSRFEPGHGKTAGVREPGQVR